MAEARESENSANSRTRQRATAPVSVVELVDLDEIHERWGVGERRIYGAVARGEIHAYGRPGRQKYYALAELVRLLGEPRYPRPLNSKRQPRPETGGDQQRFDLDIAAAA